MIEGTVTAKPQVFAAAVKWVAKFVTTRPTVPMQATILMQVAGGEMALTAYNEDGSARARIEVGGKASGSAAVSGRLLAELVGTFADKPVEITGEADGGIGLAAGRWNGTLPGMPVEDFPAMPEAPGAVGSVDGEEFAAMVRSVAVAAGGPDAKPAALMFMHIVLDEDSVDAVATNGKRAARSHAAFTLAADLGGPVDALVPAHTMSEVAAAFVGPDRIEIGWSEHQLSLTSPTRTVVLRQSGEKYDGVTIRSFTQAEMPEHVQVRTADLLVPIKRAQMVRAKDGPIKVTVSEDLITVLAEADEIKQRSGEEVDATYSGPGISSYFNPKYLSEALTSAPGDVVDMAFEPVDAGARPRPALFTVAGSPWRHVLMPIKK